MMPGKLLLGDNGLVEVRPPKKKAKKLPVHPVIHVVNGKNYALVDGKMVIAYYDPIENSWWY